MTIDEAIKAKKITKENAMTWAKKLMDLSCQRRLGLSIDDLPDVPEIPYDDVCEMLQDAVEVGEWTEKNKELFSELMNETFSLENISMAIFG